MKRILIVDFSNLLYKAVAVHGNLNHNNIYTGGLYGFITQLASLHEKYKPDRIIVCKDFPPYERSKLFPQYKERRKSQKIDFELAGKRAVAMNQTLDFLKAMGIPALEIFGLEADDMIAYMCEKFLSYDLLIASNDDDLDQLFYVYGGNIKMIRDGKLYSEDNFFEEYGNWSRKDYLHYMAIKGTHNGIPGVRGYGPKKAKEAIDKGFNEELSSRIDTIRLYKKIIRLPFRPLTLTEECLMDSAIKACNKDFIAARELLREYGIKETTHVRNLLRS